MSRSKDSFGGRGGAGFYSVSPARPCPACGARSWCQIARDGRTALCKRNGDGARERENSDGVTYFVHHLDGAPRQVFERPEVPRTTAALASVRTRDIAYRALLTHTTLTPEDCTGLEARGLDLATIRANHYRTLPDRGRAALARVVIDAVGGDDAAGVPGMIRKEDDGRAWWSFGGASGLLIPVCDLEGHVVALKVRRREAGEGPRYLWVSSARHGGPSAPCVVHVPRAARGMRPAGGGGRLVVTEGELKADVATALSGWPVVSIPGVGSWAQAIDAAQDWRAVSVAVALDMDAMTNKVVARAARCLVDELRHEGFDASVWRWDRRFKGLDDLLAARRRGEAA